jgi:hypothetical protein
MIASCYTVMRDSHRHGRRAFANSSPAASAF